jgi:hypothetical protein
MSAQARIHGLMTQLARRHETAVMQVGSEFDAEECRSAMQAYCRDVVLVPIPYVGEGLRKRLLQLQSLASTRSCERWLGARRASANLAGAWRWSDIAGAARLRHATFWRMRSGIPDGAVIYINVPMLDRCARGWMAQSAHLVASGISRQFRT